MDNNMQNMGMVKNKPKGVWGLVLIFIILLVVCAVLFFKYFSTPTKPKSTVITPIVSNTLPAGYTYKVIAKNKYPTGFPEAVVVPSVKGASAVWSRGEDTNPGTGTELKIVELTYKKTDPMDAAFAYEKSFKANGWILDIAHLNNASPVVRFFKKGTDFATVTVVKINQVDSLVNITISSKSK